jgi:sirohydrochlorin ferrochelatase
MPPALLLIDHGSRRAASNQQLAELAGLLRARWPQAPVAHAHMECAPPDIPGALRELYAAGVRELVVLPCFLFAGRHLAEDIPRILTETAAELPGLSYRLGAALGPGDDLLDLLLRRAGLADP